MATELEIDAAILASIKPHWSKVAMVLSRAEKTLGQNLDDTEFEALANRLEYLVAAGSVLAQGDLKQWRFSEVRLPNIAFNPDGFVASSFRR